MGMNGSSLGFEDGSNSFEKAVFGALSFDFPGLWAEDKLRLKSQYIAKLERTRCMEVPSLGSSKKAYRTPSPLPLRGVFDDFLIYKSLRFSMCVRIFRAIDTDGEGVVTEDRLMEIFSNPKANMIYIVYNNK